MEVGRVAAARRNGVDIQIKDVVVDRRDHEAGLFRGFPAGHGQRVGIAIGVPAELQPAAEFGVVGHQHGRPGRVENHGGTGDVAVVPAVAFEAAGLALDEFAEPRGTFCRIAVHVVIEQGKQLVPVHSFRRTYRQGMLPHLLVDLEVLPR